MKALLLENYNTKGDMKFMEKPIPKPASNQVLIKIKCSSINALDWHLMRGIWMAKLKTGWSKPKEKYNTLGADISGEVMAVGSEIKQFKKGDSVFGDIFTGGFAEYAIATENEIALIPKGVSYEQAAAIPVAGMTALKGVRDIGKVKNGDRVLVNGASGGVGTYAGQMAKHFGGHVTAVCSGRNIETVKALGADEVINYETTDFCQGDLKYDQIIDCVGNRTPREIKLALQTKGICAVIGMTSFTLLFRFMLHPSKRLKVVHVEVNPTVLKTLGELLAKGHIKSHITARVPLAQAPVAIKKTGTRRTCGKQIVEIGA
jgi:NADPH:quinone reductase-like Zn-dependent oxidoreductase